MNHPSRATRPSRAVTIAFCCAIAFAAAVQAAPIFGPRTYVTSTGKRLAFDETFTAVAETCATPAYSLVITQGNVPVTSGSVSVNGVEVVSQSDFNQQIASIAVPLAPQIGANAVHIEVGGKPGSGIEVTIVRELDQPVGVGREYAISNGRLRVTDTLAADPATAYAVVVRNGDGSRPRVSSGFVRIGELTIDVKGVAEVRRPVALQSSNPVVVDVQGPPGAVVTLQLMRVLEHCGLQIAFTEPAEGSAVTADRIQVKGTLVAALGAGVVVNDRPADVDWSHAGTAADPYRWFTTLSAEPGPVTLTAVATDPSASTGQAVRNVIYAPGPARAGLRVEPSGGVPPLDVVFTVDSTVDATANLYELDLDGDGVFEKSFDSYPSTAALGAHYATSGVRTARLRIRTTDGQFHTATAIVNVQPREVIDGFLREQWSRFTTALAAGDIDGALALTDTNARTRYRPFLELIRGRLPAYAAGITTIHQVWIGANAARYLIVRDEDGRNTGYHLYFVRDAGGVWRISQF